MHSDFYFLKTQNTSHYKIKHITTDQFNTKVQLLLTVSAFSQLQNSNYCAQCIVSTLLPLSCINGVVILYHFYTFNNLDMGAKSSALREWKLNTALPI